MTKIDGAESGRHASWLELFFDLVVVAAIMQLAHRLHGTPTPRARSASSSRCTSQRRRN